VDICGEERLHTVRRDEFGEATTKGILCGRKLSTTDEDASSWHLRSASLRPTRVHGVGVADVVPEPGRVRLAPLSLALSAVALPLGHIALQWDSVLGNHIARRI